MLALILIIAAIIVILWATAPSRHKSSADEYFAKGNISKAEELLRKVWTRRDDIPAHLAEKYFELIKKGKLNYVHKALSIKTSDLSDGASKNLVSVQNKIKKYIEDKATAAFTAEDYTDAIKYNETLIPFGKTYKAKNEEYRIYRELKNYLTSGRKSPTLNTYLSDDLPLVVKCIKNRAKDVNIPLDALKLLSLAFNNNEIKSLFEDGVLKFVLEFDQLPDLRADADRYQQTFLETLADQMPETRILEALRIYKALNSKRPSVAISEKIERLNYKRACAFIEKDDYNGFRLLQSNLKQNVDITPSFRYELGCKYNILLFDYLSKKLVSDGLKGETWDAYLVCCAEYAAIEKPDELLKIAQELNSKGKFIDSGKICRLLDQSNSNVFDLVYSNVISLLNKSTKYETLAEIYDRVDTLPRIADRCYEYAKNLGEKGEYAKAVYIGRLTEPYFSGDNSKYDVFIKDYIIHAMSFNKAELSAELDVIFGYLQKISDREIINKHLVTLEGNASSALTRGKAAEAYEISKRIYNISRESSRVFLDSALELAKKGELKTSFGISEAIAMQDDILAETEKFLPYFAKELKEPYVIGYAKRVIEIYESDPKSSLNFFVQQKDLILRGDILIEISKIDSTIFHELILDALNDKQGKLIKGTSYSDLIIRLISEKFGSTEKVLLLKDLVISGYNAKEHYTKAVLSLVKETVSLDEQLDVINDALAVVDDNQLYKNKKKIAELYIDTNPQKSLSICSEIEAKIAIIDIKLKCHIKLSTIAESLDTKHSHLSTAKVLCDSVRRAEYSEIIKIAVSLATSYFVIGKSDEGYSILKEFPGGETELAYRTRRLEDTKSISGDAAACKSLKELIDECLDADYPEDRGDDDNFLDTFDAQYDEIWHEYIRRNLQKAKKQQPEKAITSLVRIIDEIRNAFISPDGQKFSDPLISKIAELAYNVGYEYEENNEYEKAQEYYDLSNRYVIGDFSAMGRSILCQLKIGTTPYKQLSNRVQQILGKAPRKIEKDIVYRFALFSLKEGYVTEATQIAEEKLRDNKLLDLCESFRARKVQTEIEEFNAKLTLIREKKINYSDAKILHDKIEEILSPIISVFPEYRNLVREYKKGIYNYMLRAALKEEKYDILYKHYRTGDQDFTKDKTRFRNLAAVCIGMIEQGHLNDANYKDVISIWLTAVYNDYLIVRSLDHTKWDDGYTFTLDDSLSQTYGYDVLPDNINYDTPNESNVSIGHVQKSLLERSDAALSNGNKKYYDFYLEQRKAMDAYSAIKYRVLSPDDTEENIIAPYAINDILPSIYTEKMKASLNTGDREQGYRVGYMYGFRDDVFAEYDTALKYFEACVQAAKALDGISTAFMARKITAIRRFSNLFANMITELTTVLDTHINGDTDTDKLCEEYKKITKSVQDDNLSYKLADFIIGVLGRQFKAKKLTTLALLTKLFELYNLDKSNSNVCNVLAIVTGNAIMEYIFQNKSGSVTAKRLIDQIYENRSYDLQQCTSPFQHHLDELREHLDFSVQIMVGLDDSLSLPSLSSSLNEDGLRLKEAVSYLKKFAK